MDFDLTAEQLAFQASMEQFAREIVAPRAAAYRPNTSIVPANRSYRPLLASILAVIGAPFVARGVGAIVRSERGLEYACAAQALGASDLRLLLGLNLRVQSDAAYTRAMKIG